METSLLSYPTPAGAADVEHMNAGFLKLHPSPDPVHVFTSAPDEEFHDHPFDFETHIIAGSYVEEVVEEDEHGEGFLVNRYVRRAGTSHRVGAATVHRLIELPDGFCVTRARYGPTVRKPGFYRLDGDGQLWHRYFDEPDNVLFLNRSFS